MLLKYKRKKEELLLNSNIRNTYEHTTTIHEKIYNCQQKFILLIYNL